MSYQYVLHEQAQKDYEDSVKWYLERTVRQADNFVSAIDTTLDLICNNPKRWRNSYKDFYELGVKKFPLQ